MESSGRFGMELEVMLLSRSLNASSSSFVSVTPLPNLLRSADQSRRSYFGSRSFHKKRLRCLLYPLANVERTAMSLMISYLISDTWDLLLQSTCLILPVIHSGLGRLIIIITIEMC